MTKEEHIKLITMFLRVCVFVRAIVFSVQSCLCLCSGRGTDLLASKLLAFDIMLCTYTDTHSLQLHSVDACMSYCCYCGGCWLKFLLFLTSQMKWNGTKRNVIKFLVFELYACKTSKWLNVIVCVCVYEIYTDRYGDRAREWASAWVREGRKDRKREWMYSFAVAAWFLISVRQLFNTLSVSRAHQVLFVIVRCVVAVVVVVVVIIIIDDVVAFDAVVVALDVGNVPTSSQHCRSLFIHTYKCVLHIHTHQF